MESNHPLTGVILMTYGSATTAEHVTEYMQHIYPNGVPTGVIEDFTQRYRTVGWSPLVGLTEKQADRLQQKLNPRGHGYHVVFSGMLHSHPFISEAVALCKSAGATRIIGVILSPQFSSYVMDGYEKSLRKAAEKHGYSREQVTVAKPWPAEPHFIELLCWRIIEAEAKLQKQYGMKVPVVFTTHSLPERVVAKDPSYLDQLRVTTEAIVADLKDPGLPHFSGYQSAGHTPEAWLKPDLTDILAELRDQHYKAVLIVPIQFLTDHLEILYDLDVAAKAQCDEIGIAYNRIELPNTDRLFITALAEIVLASE